MIIDVTGIVLTPGNMGRDCAGNGEGEAECCCDECDYLQCCTGYRGEEDCRHCRDTDCPRCAVPTETEDLSE